MPNVYGRVYSGSKNNVSVMRKKRKTKSPTVTADELIMIM